MNTCMKLIPDCFKQMYAQKYNVRTKQHIIKECIQQIKTLLLSFFIYLRQL